MIQTKPTQSSLLTPHSIGRGVEHLIRRSPSQEKAEPEWWDDDGVENIDLRFEPGTHVRGFMLIPRGLSRTFSGLGTNGDQACSPKIRSHTSLPDIWKIMLRIRRLM